MRLQPSANDVNPSLTLPKRDHEIMQKWLVPPSIPILFINPFLSSYSTYSPKEFSQWWTSLLRDNNRFSLTAQLTTCSPRFYLFSFTREPAAPCSYSPVVVHSLQIAMAGPPLVSSFTSQFAMKQKYYYYPAGDRKHVFLYLERNL